MGCINLRPFLGQMGSCDRHHTQTGWGWKRLPHFLLHQLTQSQLPRPVPSQGLSIFKNGSTTTSLGNLCQCLIPLKAKISLLVLTGFANFYFGPFTLFMILGPLPHVLHTEKSPASSFSLPSTEYLYTWIRPPHFQLPHPFLIWEMLWFSKDHYHKDP